MTLEDMNVKWLNKNPLQTTCFKAFVPPNTPPNSLKDSNVSLKMKTTEEKGVEGCSLTRNTSRGGMGVRRACWSFGMGTRMNDKGVNYSHGLAQTKQQIG
jgi:hypothetical protein